MKFPLLISKCIARVEEDLLFMRASSLTYQTFLAIVPLLAVMFGVAKGFGIDNAFETFLRTELSEHKEILEYLLSFSQTTLHEAQGGVVAGTGIAVLFFTAMRLFSSVEETFNIMWGIDTPRRYIHRAISYLALIVICPLLLVIAGSSTIFLSTHLSLLTKTTFFSHFSPLVAFSVSLIPWATLVILFSSMLYIIPSARVSFRSALLSGIVAASFFQMLQLWYIQLQLGLTKISAIYGSFVALPLFLVWLWMSWCIFLLSGELCVIFEERLWKFSRYAADIDPKICDIAILTLAITHYRKGVPISLSELSRELNIPLKSLYKALEDLKTRGLLHEAIDDSSSSITLLPSIYAFSYTLSELIFDFQKGTNIDTEENRSSHSFVPTENTSLEIMRAYERVQGAIKVLDAQPDSKISHTEPL